MLYIESTDVGDEKYAYEYGLHIQQQYDHTKYKSDNEMEGPMRVKERESEIDAIRFQFDGFNQNTIKELIDFIGRDCDIAIEFRAETGAVMTIERVGENNPSYLRSGDWLVRIKPWGTDRMWPMFYTFSNEEFVSRYEEADDEES